MSSILYAEQNKVVAATGAGATADYGRQMGAYSCYNKGAKDCWGRLDGIPVASDMDGQFFLKAGGRAHGASRANFRTITFITAGMDTTTVEVTATIACQD